ncbi:unnamed protein product [Paramecium pentaurelia]|uniref:B box-type domain-containing protein n=1 Tax=Paramecium pentaurelia TaxID=43138 RepID=A0A8S1T747_9CILI|nr:unnamed protein product [Paramecium pentaurelia]
MSDTESELLECCKCGAQVDQILSLQCDHNLCLNCAAKAVSKWGQYTMYPPLICQICSSKTQLDPSAVQVLLEMNPQSSCCSDDFEQRSEILETKQSQQIQQSDYHNQSQQQQFTNITCQQHLTESCVLYCFTCEAQCFCMECYLQGLHKNHEVRNISKSFDLIRENGNQLQVSLQSCCEYLLHEQCKIVNKKQDLVDLVGQAKMQITSNFEDIYKTLKLKEQEMLQAADELVADKLIEIEGLMAKIKLQTDRVNQYNEQLVQFFGSTNPNVSLCVEACNYVVKEKKKIQNLIEQIRQEKISPTIQGKFCLDSGSIQQMINDMRGVKLQLVSLRGIESINPTQREQYIYQKAIEDKTRDSMIGNNQVLREEKENNNSISFIERSSQKKSIKTNDNRDFYSKFHEAKRSIMNQKSFI